MGFPDFYILGIGLMLLCGVAVIGDVLFLTTVAVIRCWNRYRERQDAAERAHAEDEFVTAAYEVQLVPPGSGQRHAPDEDTVIGEAVLDGSEDGHGDGRPVGVLARGCGDASREAVSEAAGLADPWRLHRRSASVRHAPSSQATRLLSWLDHRQFPA